jgi:hypothetical protein
VNERQRYALLHPLASDGSVEDEKTTRHQTRVRPHPTRPFLLMSILAVDR